MKITLSKLRNLIIEEVRKLNESKQHLTYRDLQSQFPDAAAEWKELAMNVNDGMDEKAINRLCGNSYFEFDGETLIGDGVVEFTTYKWDGMTWNDADDSSSLPPTNEPVRSRSPVKFKDGTVLIPAQVGSSVRVDRNRSGVPVGTHGVIKKIDYNYEFTIEIKDPASGPKQVVLYYGDFTVLD